MIILDTVKLVEIYVKVDDFMLEFEPLLERHLLGDSGKWRGKMSKSEMMTVLIFFHLSGIRCFAWYYKEVVQKLLSSYFPYTYNYQNFISLQSACNLELFAFLSIQQGLATEANYIDSKPLEVCHLKREKQHKVFKGIAQKGKSSTGFFYGLKLHLICNQAGEILRFLLSPGNVPDNGHKLLRAILKDFKGKVYGDKGYLSQLKTAFEEQGCKLITKIKKNMKKQQLSAEEGYYLKKRGLIETVFMLMVSQCQIEHTRHRSPKNFITNLWAGMIAYTFLDKLPHIKAFQMKTQIENIVLLEDYK